MPSRMAKKASHRRPCGKELVSSAMQQMSNGQGPWRDRTVRYQKFGLKPPSTETLDLRCEDLIGCRLKSFVIGVTGDILIISDHVTETCCSELPCHSMPGGLYT